MKVTIIHGQSHKGSTYHISKILADKIGGEVKEFFLPRDFGEFCIGCTQCFRKSETLCPHYEKMNPLTEALDDCDTEEERNLRLDIYELQWKKITSLIRMGKNKEAVSLLKHFVTIQGKYQEQADSILDKLKK